jgi:serine/threonine protein kinase
MNPEAQMEEAVCVAALHITDPALRAQFLDRACAGDARLRAAVEAMLQADPEARVYFERSQAEVDALEVDARAADALKEAGVQLDDFTGEQLGSQVGRYQLVQKIGEGGCGVVYLAEQEQPVRRQVALKVIKLGMDTKSVIARFEAERQALAMMDHPNIARVLDAGATEAGRPFFVMELVRGTRITKYCDENNLDTVQRLKLFIQVCRAIQHAHQKGVIHRDIKPSNILITVHDGLPMPKVIDFGIAKATEGRLTDNTMFTAAEQFVGTPAYMSPEQADISGLDVDTRSDIYSLGVLLYELLTGRTPFDTKALMQSGMDEMRRTLREKEPQLPSTMITSLRRTELALAAGQRHTEPPKLISQLKGDLDWIVMKALEKDRNRRYDTANGLALDVQRFIDSEPVLARPPGRLYRLKKLVRRNKIVFAAAGAVAAALLMGLGLSTWLFLRERDARVHEREARFHEQNAREREAQLRAEAEDRAKITQAVMFIHQGKYDDANETLNQVKYFPPDPTLDCVSAFRSVGDWLAVNGRWQQAAERYAALIQIDKLDNNNQISLDYEAYGVVLAVNQDFKSFRNLWSLAVTNFSAPPNDPVFSLCVLLPLDKRQILTLKPMADALERRFPSIPPSRFSDWNLLSISLWKYRRGDYEKAIEWCQREMPPRGKFAPAEADLHLILAMSYSQLGRMSEACSELAQGRQMVEPKLQGGLNHNRVEGSYWFDWMFAGVLLKEAAALVDCNAAQSETER